MGKVLMQALQHQGANGTYSGRIFTMFTPVSFRRNLHLSLFLKGFERFVTLRMSIILNNFLISIYINTSIIENHSAVSGHHDDQIGQI